ncbi:transposase [candidate division TA06 bacterium]|uniref:Transposase n=1 Tax=candidate division TA06 bacterium TaxID=2250710 RepID=A0A933IB81_UNCT6|nr:transposase [candidate division TA06 bacterium]
MSVAANNVDDGKILGNRLEKLKQKTSDLNEMHVDGAYPNAENDVKCQELKITMVQTGIKGTKSDGVEITISKDERQRYTVSCPGQTVAAENTSTRYKAQFDATCCAGCPLAGQCKHASGRPACRSGGAGRYYFTDKDYQRKQRQANIYKLPPERQKLRANVEASVPEFKRDMPGGKVKVRGNFKTIIFAMISAVVINFGRIVRYLVKVRDYIIKNGRICLVAG